MTMIADLYIRVSTDEQAEKGYSQRDQEDRLRKYCEILKLNLRNVYLEDHSAKTFDRPVWQKLLRDLRKQKKSDTTTLILFTKWDRFSRNAGDAYQMLNVLQKLSVEARAIEQPLDLAIPENKIMLAFYLAAPEVENDRRSLNIFHGMRRAKKEGRYMGSAVVGYVNKIGENKNKYIAIHEVEGPILKWAFEQILENRYNTEQIWKLVREKAPAGCRFSKNNFWLAIRNPLYCGKIYIPPYKDEKGYYVKGQHEPLITESMFEEVQNILDNRKRAIKPKIVSMENLPLRGFLKCPNCGRVLTGSASRGKLGKYYTYYHCTTQCGTRFSAEETNAIFEKQLSELIPKPGMLEVFREAVLEDYKTQTKVQDGERKRLLDSLDTYNNRMRNALIQKVDGKLDDNDFNSLKKDTTAQIEEIEKQLEKLSDLHKDVRQLLSDGLKQLSRLDIRYINGNIEEKRDIVSSMFPEKLVFDGTRHRTQRINEAINLIYQRNSKLRDKKKGTNHLFFDLSPQVQKAGLEPAHLTAHAPETCVSTNFTTSAERVQRYTFRLFSKHFFAESVSFSATDSVLSAYFTPHCPIPRPHRRQNPTGTHKAA